MRDGPRWLTIINLLHTVLDQGISADLAVRRWSKASRFAGSKDRRAVRELVYDAIRHCGPVPESGRAAMLALSRDFDR